MWVVFVVLFAVAVVVELVDVGGTLFGMTVERPAVFGYWESTAQLLVAAGAVTVGFWYLAGDYEEEFVGYLFSDYVVATDSGGPDVEVTVYTGDQAEPEVTAGGDETDD